MGFLREGKVSRTLHRTGNVQRFRKHMLCPPTQVYLQWKGMAYASEVVRSTYFGSVKKEMRARPRTVENREACFVQLQNKVREKDD